MNNKIFQDENWNYYYTVIPMMLFVVVFLTWASLSHIDEVVKGIGKVVPSSQTKIVQNLEGGIIESIAVKEGENVLKGQLLYTLSNAFFSADLKTKEIELLSFKASEIRIQSLIEGKNTIEFPQEYIQSIPDIVENEKKLFYEELENNERKIQITRDQVNQKQYKLNESQNKYKNLTVEYKLAQENMKILETLYRKQVVSKKEYIAELSKKQSIATRLEEIQNSIPIIKEELSEANKKVEATQSEIRSKLLTKYSTLKVEINKLVEGIKANSDRELRKEVISPVNGIVNKMYFNTIGGIVKSSDIMAEVTPIEDSLSIEAKIKTSDRALIWVGQKVNIEITAFDFSKYGLLEGKIISISPDSFEDKNGFVYYSVKVEAKDYQFAPDLQILPGMVANINILTGKKTILEYILKPLKDIQKNAMNEQ